MNQSFNALSLLAEACWAGKLLLVWADAPFHPQETLRQPEALLINQWQSAAADCPALPWVQVALPPLPVLSLDPTARLEAATSGAVPVATLRDVVAPGRPTVLKLAGDLAARAGLFLTWDNVRTARSDRDKAHLLREAAHIAAGGIVLVLAPNPGPSFDRFWTTLLAPALRDAERILVLGPSDYAWPAPLACIGSIDEATAILSHLREMKPSVPRIQVQPEEARLDYTDLQIRIDEFVDAMQAYPVEAHLASGAHFAGCQLRLDETAFVKPVTDIAHYGADLFDALFAGPIHDAYVQARTLAGASTDGRVRLRLWIASEAASLHAIPWEGMHYPIETRYLPLTTAAKLPFSRYVGLTQAEPAPVSQRPLHMLAIIANPLNLESYAMPPLDVDTEVTNMLDTLDSIPNTQLQLTIMPGHTGLSTAMRTRVLEAGYQLCEGSATLETLLHFLAHNPTHILHIVAHGRFSRDQKTAALCLENENGYVQWTKGDDLASRLAQLDILPHLIFLSACESAARAPGNQNPFVGLAPQLVEIGVPAVVAMQDTIPIVLARQLTRAFYGYLLGHGVVDRALNQARLLLYDVQHTDWITPVLFMRLQEGKLFSV